VGGVAPSHRPHQGMFPPLQRIHRVFFATILFLVLIGSVLAIVSPALFFTCDYNLYERHDNPDTRHTTWMPRAVRHFVTFYPFRLFFILPFCLASYRYYRFNQKILYLLLPLLMCVAYEVTILASGWLKSQSSDMECATLHKDGTLAHNGVSGHFTFYLFLATMMGHLHCLPMHPTYRRIYRWMEITMTSIIVHQAIVTITYGYHSLWQAWKGSLVGSVAAWGTLWLLHCTWKQLLPS
jgi:hypothetical protein